MKQAGKFYGIGVGPGDPELMTLKAVRTIRDCDVIVLPVSNRELTEPLLLEQNEMENRAAGYLESCTAYQIDRKSTRLNSSHPSRSRMPSSA